jgi:transcription-repair coupling factor (superfamily II helicase)
MPSAGSCIEVSNRLEELVGRLNALPGFAEAVASLWAGRGATLGGVWGSSCALVAAALAKMAPGPLVVVLPHAADADAFADDVRLFLPKQVSGDNAAPEPGAAHNGQDGQLPGSVGLHDLRIQRFPAREAFAKEQTLHDEVYGERLRLLKDLSSNHATQLTKRGGEHRTSLIVTSIQALIQGVPPPELLRQQTRLLRVRDSVELDELVSWLVAQGFQNTPGVQLPGEFSRRGGILDVFAPDWLDPVRIEFFGDEIESIRAFEVASQRSLSALQQVNLTALDATAEAREPFASYLPPDTWFLLVEPSELEEEGQRYWNRLERPHDYFTVHDVFQAAYRFPTATAEALAAGSLETTCHLPFESIERFSGDVQRVRRELDAAAAGQEVFLICQTEAETKRLREIFADSQLAAEGRLHFTLGRLRAGFRFRGAGIEHDRQAGRLHYGHVVLISDNELFHRADLVRRCDRRLGRVIDSFLELRKGDLVVHVAHGVARYLGLELIEKGDYVEEHLELEFHGGTKIYVPVSKIDLVQKYVGSTKRRPTLARIGGKSWVRQKNRAEQAVLDLASDLLELQALRASQPGISFAVESDWQREFEAAFPYTETPDQLAAMEAIHADMLRAQPTDRLLCGDVGYGKTELAMRAAFKAVDNGYQVAVLVPTTILAEQHYRTFSERMAEYPFQIARLSRFCTSKEEREIVTRCQGGGVDIVIGTHRLAQPDVQFSNLGLVVIDEEQRFGVDIKERLKKLRETVDVLTLTATPIPRTLHMSLLGLRDISNLETPPADRQAVETHVTRFDADLIRHAVLRELNREGQIFFVHNRVQDIEVLATRLRQIVPEARLAIGHGQMPEGELERVMLGFVNREFDLLLATTIIESGLDIPNANTMFIDEADRYGLADMHQLRGRVGRYKHRAYCYLLVDPNKSLTPAAARRLRAIEEFSEMGAGFAIAMRDLEIRGAGNILGTEQSGHINAVGYELYCTLLENAVRGLKRLPPRITIDVNVTLPGRAYLPRQYVPDMRMKIDLYRRLVRVGSEAELAELRAEMLDRFGPLPEVVERLLRVMLLRLLAARWQIESVHLEDRYLVFAYTSRPQIDRLARASRGAVRVVDARSAYLTLGKELKSPDEILSRVEAVLRAE